MIDWTTRKAKQILIAIVGGSLVLLGIALLVLPGPGIAIIAAGIGVLAFEFEAPRRWQRRGVSAWREWRQNRHRASGSTDVAAPATMTDGAPTPLPGPTGDVEARVRHE